MNNPSQSNIKTNPNHQSSSNQQNLTQEEFNNKLREELKPSSQRNRYEERHIKLTHGNETKILKIVSKEINDNALNLLKDSLYTHYFDKKDALKYQQSEKILEALFDEFNIIVKKEKNNLLLSFYDKEVTISYKGERLPEKVINTLKQQLDTIYYEKDNVAVNDANKNIKRLLNQYEINIINIASTEEISQFEYKDKTISLSTPKPLDESTKRELKKYMDNVFNQSKNNLDKDKIANNEIELQKFCNKHGVALSSLEYENQKKISGYLKNYHGIPIANSIEITNAVIAGKIRAQKISCNDCNILDNSSFVTDKLVLTDCRGNSQATIRGTESQESQCDEVIIHNFEGGLKISGAIKRFKLLSDENTTLWQEKAWFDLRETNIKSVSFFYKELDRNNFDAKAYTKYDISIPPQLSIIGKGFDLNRDQFQYGYTSALNFEDKTITLRSKTFLDQDAVNMITNAIKKYDEDTLKQLSEKFELKISRLKYNHMKKIKLSQEGTYHGIPFDDKIPVNIVNTYFPDDFTTPKNVVFNFNNCRNIPDNPLATSI